MKLKLIILLVCLTHTLFITAQNLTITDLIALRALESDDISIALMAKGWTYMDSENSKTRWAFKPNDNRAIAWVNLIYNEDDFYKYSIIYQSGNNTRLTALKKELINLHFKKDGSYNISDKIISYYSSANHEVTLTILSGESSNFFTIEVKKLPSPQQAAKIEKKRRQEKAEEEISSLIIDRFILLQEIGMLESEGPYHEYIQKKEELKSLDLKIQSLRVTIVLREVRLKEKPTSESNDKLDSYTQKIITLNQGDSVTIFNDKIFDNYTLILTKNNQFGYLRKSDLKFYAANKSKKTTVKK